MRTCHAPVQRWTRRGPRRRTRDDTGSISLLSLGWIVVVAMALLVVGAASSVHLDRVRLLALADEITLAAADSVDGDAYYTSSATVVTLDDATVSAVARERLSSDPARPWVGEVTVAVADAPDGVSARVVLHRTVSLPWNMGALAPWSAGIDITASSTARVS